MEEVSDFGDILLPGHTSAWEEGDCPVAGPILLREFILPMVEWDQCPSTLPKDLNGRRLIHPPRDSGLMGRRPMVLP